MGWRDKKVLTPEEQIALDNTPPPPLTWLEKRSLEDKQKKERRIAAKISVKEARLVLEAQQAIVKKATDLLIECEKVLKLAEAELQAADPRLRGARFDTAIPAVGTQSSRILMLCSRARQADDISKALGMTYAQVNVLLSNLHKADFMIKPTRGWYQTRYAVLVHYGLRKWEEYEDDGIDPV